MISLSKVSAMWASNPISLANWLIWLSPIHTFTAHSEESAFRGQKYQTWQIFSSPPCVAKFSRKLRRTREETAVQTALPGNFLSCFFSCAASLRNNDVDKVVWKTPKLTRVHWHADTDTQTWKTQTRKTRTWKTRTCRGSRVGRKICK